MALWVSNALWVMHALIVEGNRWLSWPPEDLVLSETVNRLFYAVVIYFLSKRQYWALLIYAVILAIRTVAVTRFQLQAPTLIPISDLQEFVAAEPGAV